MEYLKYLKIPYKINGRDFKGCDCLGLVILYYQEELGISLPEPTSYTFDWYRGDPELILNNYKSFGFSKTTDKRKGDILVLLESNLPKHLGIILDHENFIHMTRKGVAIHSYIQGTYSQNIVTTLRHIKVNQCL